MEPVTKKKILYIVTKSNFGGAQRYVFELSVAMKSEGFEVAVACGGNGELVARLNEVEIKTFEIAGAQRDINFMKEIQAISSLIKIIRTYKPDIIHLNSSKIGLLGSFCGRILSVPKIVFTAHGWPFLEPRGWVWKSVAWLGSYLTSIFSHEVILVSENDKAHTHMLGVLSKTSVIHPSISNFPLLSREEARARLFSPEIIEAHFSNIWLITHGEINHNKNLTTVIDAIAEFNSVHQTKIFYTIIGSGDLESSLQEQVELKGITEYVNFVGYKADARQYLLAFDMYVISSLKEGLPYSLLEAGLVGLPSIASNVGGIPEVVSDYESGLLINPQNHMSIVDALDFLLNNPDKRSIYSDNLSRHIKNNFDLLTMFKKTLEIYVR